MAHEIQPNLVRRGGGIRGWEAKVPKKKQIRQWKTDSGLGLSRFQAKVFKTF